MTRFGRRMATGLLLIAAGLAAACSNSAGGRITGSTQTDGDAPGGMTNANPCWRLTRFLITSLMENQEVFRLPVFKTAFYDQSALCLMHPCEVSNGSILSQKNTAIFNARSADYGAKSRS